MEYYGKRKCRILKEIRAEIAKQNDIEWVVEECRHKGNCKGTCPKCEAEVVKLEKELARRQALGKAVAVVGVSAAMTIALTGCDDTFLLNKSGGVYPAEEHLMGDMAMPEETDTSGLQGGATLPEEDTALDAGLSSGQMPSPDNVPEAGE